MAELDFEGRVHIVTGAGRGMGAAHARELAKRGARVVINDIGGDLFGEGVSEGPASQVAEEIVKAGGVAVADQSDIGTASGCEAVVKTAVDEFGQLDGVLHNAGIAGFTPLADLEEQNFERMLRVHLFGGMNLTRFAWPHLAKSGGRLLYISSGAGFYGSPTLAHYASAKVGLVGLSRVAASEGREAGISANVLAVASASRMMDEVMADAPGMKDWFHQYMKPELPSAAAVWLQHAECPATGRVFQAFGPHFGEVLIAETRGVNKLDMTAEGYRDHFDQIGQREDFFVPDGPDEFHAEMFGAIISAGADPPSADDDAPAQFTAESN